MTFEEVRRGLEALERIKQINKEILARRGGVPFTSSVEIIHEMREERDRQLAEAMGWSSDWEEIDGDDPSEES